MIGRGVVHLRVGLFRWFKSHQSITGYCSGGVGFLQTLQAGLRLHIVPQHMHPEPRGTVVSFVTVGALVMFLPRVACLVLQH